MNQNQARAGPDPAFRTREERSDKLRVLVADTDAAARRVCAGYCDLFDFDCAVAASRREAMTLIGRERFDVALVELAMASGAFPVRLTPPLIGLAPIVRADEAQRWLAAGFADVLAKPVTAARLFAAVHGVVDGATDASRSWAVAAG